MELIGYTLKYNGELIINGLAVKILHNQATSLCCYMSFILKIVYSFRHEMVEDEENEADREFAALAKEHRVLSMT